MMDIQIRRLNRAGIREMSEFHRRIYRDNSTEDPPMHLLDDEEFSSSFVPPVPSSLVVDSSGNLTPSSKLVSTSVVY